MAALRLPSTSANAEFTRGTSLAVRWGLMRLALAAMILAIHTSGVHAEVPSPRPVKVTEPDRLLLASAKIEGDPRNAQIDVAVASLAASLRINLVRQGNYLQTRTMDMFEVPSRAELEAARSQIDTLCLAHDGEPPTASPGQQAAVRAAANVLYRASDVAPQDAGLARNNEGAAYRAHLCLGDALPDGTGPKRMTANASVMLVGVDRRQWVELYVDGIAVGGHHRYESDEIEFYAPTDRDVWLHVRCDRSTRCSQRMRIRAGMDRPRQHGLLASTWTGHLSSTFDGFTYADEVARNNAFGWDVGRWWWLTQTQLAEVTRAAEAAPGALTVMAEADALRLSLTNGVGQVTQSIRVAPDQVVTAAQRLLNGAGDPAVGHVRAGWHEVEVRFVDGSDTRLTARSVFDAVPVDPGCGAHCRFAAPPGRVTLALPMSGNITRTFALTGPLAVDVAPRKRDAARVMGGGLMGLGGLGMLGAMAPAAIRSAIASGVCDAANSGPNDCDDRDEKFTKTEGAVFWASAGTLAVGAVLYFLVHKRATIKTRRR